MNSKAQQREPKCLYARSRRSDRAKKPLLKTSPTSSSSQARIGIHQTGIHLENVTWYHRDRALRAWVLQELVSKDWTTQHITARGTGSSLHHTLCSYFQHLNLSLQIKTLEKNTWFSKSIAFGKETPFQATSRKAGLKCPESLVTPEKHSLVVCMLRDCKTASMKLPDGEIKKTVLRQHPDNMQSTSIETIINFKNTG